MNLNLDYLTPYSHQLNFEKLRARKEEQNKNFQRKSFDSYRIALESLPPYTPGHQSLQLDRNRIKIGLKEELTPQQWENLVESCKKMIPWRKGPFDFFGIEIDAEWRSHLKWQRLAPFLDNLQGRCVLDIGANNGYFMFRMAAMNPQLVLGIDPTASYSAQYSLLQHFAQIPNMHFENWGIDDVGYFQNLFHTVFFMGILYHHPNPLLQLSHIWQAMRPGGQLILETIVIPGEESHALFPSDRYAKMRNIWFIPTVSCTLNWLKKAHFVDLQVLSLTPSTVEEQRTTSWCPPPRQSLADFLNEEKTHTAEGHPAPLRLCVSARKKSLR